MDTRLIIAYTLIAFLVGAFVFAGVIISRKRQKTRRMHMGRGKYNDYNPPVSNEQR